jgi:hypothetical protein
VADRWTTNGFVISFDDHPRLVPSRDVGYGEASELVLGVVRLLNEHRVLPPGVREEPARKLFVIRDMRSIDIVLLWRANGNGYTTYLDEAGRYEEDEAREIESLRGTDLAISLEEAEGASHRVVGVDALSEILNESSVTPALTPAVRE